MKVRLASALAVCVFAGSTTAAELPFTPERFGEAFNAVARAADVKIRVTKTDCVTKEATVCSYRLNDVFGMNISGPPKGRARDLFSVFGGKETNEQNTAESLLAIRVVIALLAPKSDVQERRAAFDTLIRIVADDKPTKAELDGVSFAMKAPKDMGLWFTAEAAK